MDKDLLITALKLHKGKKNKEVRVAVPHPHGGNYILAVNSVTYDTKLGMFILGLLDYRGSENMDASTVVTGFNKGIGRCANEDTFNLRTELKRALQVNSDPSLWRYQSGQMQLTGSRLFAVASVFTKFGITEWYDNIVNVNVESKTTAAQ